MQLSALLPLVLSLPFALAEPIPAATIKERSTPELGGKCTFPETGIIECNDNRRLLVSSIQNLSQVLKIHCG